jgi:hypothetical protein
MAGKVDGDDAVTIPPPLNEWRPQLLRTGEAVHEDERAAIATSVDVSEHCQALLQELRYVSERPAVDERVSVSMDPFPPIVATPEDFRRTQVPASFDARGILGEGDGGAFDHREPCDISRHPAVDHLDLAGSGTPLRSDASLSVRGLRAAVAEPTNASQDRSVFRQRVRRPVTIDPRCMIPAALLGQLDEDGIQVDQTGSCQASDSQCRPGRDCLPPERAPCAPESERDAWLRRATRTTVLRRHLRGLGCRAPVPPVEVGDQRVDGPGDRRAGLVAVQA